ncbi:SAV_2336 N-terminal domain-related protein [Streptomyces sp. NPDC005244]|uniref:SAV_2336 N-terminal domain-related protein n=1 Tax=Streptomyces sp. NPDC005244 TaxID=3364708 RepID=UPI0036A526A4
MTLFDSQPWLITAAPVPAVDQQWRTTLPFEPVFLEPPPSWPTVSPLAAVEAATSALSPFSQLTGGTPPRLAASIYDPPEGLADSPPAPNWDLVLVIDTSPSMTAWYPVANAIVAYTRDLPLFHSVQVVKMNNRRPAGPSDLFNQTDLPILNATSFAADRSKITLLLTDGVGASWHRRLLWGDLHQWATSHAVAILHVLPHHHWSLSGISTQPIQLSAPRQCCPNKDLETTPAGDRSATAERCDTAVSADVLIPVLEIRKRWLDQWTQLLLTNRLVHQQVLQVSPAASPLPVVPSPAAAGDDAPGPDRLIADFHSAASEHAFALAVLLATAPLNQFVMQLIAAELVPAATTRDLSAILTSGLLISLDTPVGVAAPYGRIDFDFLPGVRQSLLALGESSQTHRATDLLDARLSPFAPALQGLASRTRTPSIDQLPSHTTQSAPYLEIEHCLLTALSGESAAHRVVAKTLRERLDAATAPGSPITVSAAG